MITQKERKSLIIKYLEKNPLSSPRQIRTNHSAHEYKYEYLKKFLEELASDKKITIFLKKYYAVPKVSKEINLLINIIKSKSLDKPTFKKLEFIITKKNLTTNTLINNCICLYHVKQKINEIEKTVPSKSFPKHFIKFLKTFSFDHNYTDDFVIKNDFKEKSKKKEDIQKSESEKRVLSFLRLNWGFSSEYLTHLKSNKIPLKELFHRVFELYNSDRSSTALKFGTSNKALKRSLDRLVIEQEEVLKSSTSFDSEGNRIEPKIDMYGIWHERSRILDIGIGILGHRLSSKRKKYAKNMEECTGIPFTKLIPMKGYSNLLKDAPTEPFQSIDPLIRREYEAHYKEIGMPPYKIIPTDGSEPYYLFHDPKDFSKLTREWKGTK